MQDALKLIGANAKRQERFNQCGAACTVLLNVQSGERKLCGSYCRDRLCVPCGTARGAWIAANLRSLMAGKVCRHVILTRRSYGKSLEASLDSLVKAFEKLRKTRFWRRYVKGGAAMIEVKRGKRSGQWHCHYHIICHGTYLDQKELSREWLDITADSTNVYIRAIEDDGAAAGYVTKYVSKPLEESVFKDTLDLCECIIALHGRRMCNTFGDWRGVELEEKPDDGDDWIAVGSLDAILRLAEQGDPDAHHVTRWFRVDGWGNGPRAASESG